MSRDRSILNCALVFFLFAFGCDAPGASYQLEAADGGLDEVGDVRAALAAAGLDPNAAGDIVDIQLEGSRIGMLVGDTLLIREAGAWRVRRRQIAQFDLDGNRIGMLTTDGEFLVHEGPVTVLQVQGGTRIQLAAGRMAVLDENGTLWVKEGLGGQFSRIMTNVDDFQLEGNRIGVLVGGLLRVKAGALSAAWTNVYSGVTEFQLEGDRIAVLTPNNDPYTGTLRVKAGGLSAGWTVVHRLVDQFQLEGNRIGVLSGHELFVKAGGLSATFHRQASLADSFLLAKDRIAYTTVGFLRVKQGKVDGGSYRTLHGSARLYTMLDNNIVAVVPYGRKRLLVQRGSLSSPLAVEYDPG